MDDNNEWMIRLARAAAAHVFNDAGHPTKNEELLPDDLNLVWFSKTLQHFKCLLCTTRPDHLYFEVTYNGDRFELYVDIYDKLYNDCVKAFELKP